MEKSIKDTRESLSVEIKYNQAKIKKNTLTEMQSTMVSLTSRVSETGEIQWHRRQNDGKKGSWGKERNN